MTVRGTVIATQPVHKFIGVMVDQELHWRQQANYVMAKASKWVLAFRRLAQPASGVKMQLMQQLYCVVAVPKITYTADIWYTPMVK